MSEKQILLLPTKAKVSREQLADLKESGFIVLRLDDPKAARIISADASPIEGSALLLNVLKVIRKEDTYSAYRGLVDAIISEMVGQVGK